MNVFILCVFLEAFMFNKAATASQFLFLQISERVFERLSVTNEGPHLAGLHRPCACVVYGVDLIFAQISR